MPFFCIKGFIRFIAESLHHLINPVLVVLPRRKMIKEACHLSKTKKSQFVTKHSSLPP